MDETFSAQAVQYHVGDFAEFLSNEAGMGPWYICLWLWARLTGFSGEWLRLWSVIGAALSIALFQRVVRSTSETEPRQTWVAFGLIILACHPSFLLAMTEARAYSWMMTGAIASLILLDRVRRVPRHGRLLALAICAGVAAGLHPVSLYLQATMFAMGLIYARPTLSRRRLTVASCLAIALATPFYLVTLRSGESQTEWIGPLTVERIARALTNYLGGVPGAFLTTPLVIAGFVMALGARPKSPWSLTKITQHFQNEILIALPILLLLAQSFFVNGFSGRYLTPLVPVLALEIVKGSKFLVESRRTSIRATAPIALLLVTLVALPQELLLRERDRGGSYRELSRSIDKVLEDDLAVVIPDPTLAQGIWFYATQNLRAAFHPQPDSDPRPWDKFEHESPITSPQSCELLIIDKRSGNELQELMSIYFGRSWATQMTIGSSVDLSGLRVTEVSYPVC